MSSQPRGYVDKEYLDRAGEELISLKRLSHESLHLQPGHKVLDVGCGPATDTIPLADWVGPSGQVIGVDHDPEMVTEANRRTLAAGVRWVEHQCADVNELPFQSSHFDAARAERLLIHLVDPARALGELARVTKPGGRVVVLDTDFGALSLDTTETEIERRLVHFFARHMLNNAYCGRRLRRLFKQQGLVDVTARAVCLPVVDYALARRLWLMDRLESDALEMGVVTAAELGRLKDDWERTSAAGGFFASVTMILASASKR